MGYEKEKLLPIQTRIIVALKTLIKNGAFSKNLFALLNQDRPKLVEIRAECEAIMRADNNYKKISIGRRLFSDCPSPLLVALCEKISALEVENVKACAVLAQWLESTLPSKTTALAR